MASTENLFNPQVIKRCNLTGIVSASFGDLITAFNNMLLSVHNQGSDVLDVIFEVGAGNFSLSVVTYTPYDYVNGLDKSAPLKKKCFVAGFSNDTLELMLYDLSVFMYETLPFDGKDVMKVMYKYDGTFWRGVIIYFETYYFDFLTDTTT